MRKYIYKVKKYIVLQVLFYFIYTIAIAFIPYLRKILVDYGASKGMNCVLLLILLYSGVVVVSELTIYISEKYVWKTAINFENSLKKDLFCCYFKNG